MSVSIISLFSFAMSMLTGCGPDRLQEVANVPGFHVWGLHADGDLLYAAVDERGLVIFDISDPASPRLVGESMPSEERGAFAVVVAGQYAYLADGYDLFVIDISDPTQPVVVGQVSGANYKLAVQGNHVYGMGGKLNIYDVSTPAAPELAGELEFTSAGGPVAASSGLVYMGNDLEGIHIIDASDPAQPTILNTYEAQWVSSVAAEGEFVYGVESDGLFIVDVADPLQPRFRGRHATTCHGGINSLSLHNSYAYLSGDDCLEVYDVSDVESPRLAATLDALVPRLYWSVAASNGYIFAGDSSGLRIIPQES